MTQFKFAIPITVNSYFLMNFFCLYQKAHYLLIKHRNLKRIFCLVALIALSCLTVSCNLSNDLNPDVSCIEPQVWDDTQQVCRYALLPEPLPNPLLQNRPEQELAQALDNELIIHYLPLLNSVSEGDVEENPYEGWSLFLWNNEHCSALTDDSVSQGWDDQSQTPSGFDSFGPYWRVNLAEVEGCVNFIIRGEGLVKLIEPDLRVNFAEFPDRTVTLISNQADVFDRRILAWNANPISLGQEMSSAHWLDAEYIVWPEAEESLEIRLLFSEDASIKVREDGTLSGHYQSIPLQHNESNLLPISLQQRFPDLSDWPVIRVPREYPVKSFLKQQLYLIALTNEGYIKVMTKLQLPGVLDSLFTSTVDDSDQWALGVSHIQSEKRFSLWAPTAQTVKLHFYNEDKEPLIDPESMEFDEGTGIWSGVFDVKEGTFYQYEIQVYHYLTDSIETFMVTDPYSTSLSANSLFSQVVDLSDNALKPVGWDKQVQPEIEDIVIYEAHLRDFTVASDISSKHKGKYLALTEEGTLPLKHLENLFQSGVSFFHLLPVFDIATIPELESEQITLEDSLKKLCRLNTSALICNANHDETQLLRELFEQCDPSTQCAETLMDDMRSIDAFNWGYDPLHYGVPEGSYAVNPEGNSRIIEFRKMIQALHRIGLRVVMDVVYNHTHASGVAQQSILDKIVPGYYHRLDRRTGEVLTSTCCANTATEHRMMAKLMQDTLEVWVRDYHIDGFRFDLMGVQPLSVMQSMKHHFQKTSDREVLFYGEGWNLGDGVEQRFEPAQQLNLAGSGIASFSDRLRDAVRGGGPFDQADTIRQNQGIANGLFYAPNEFVVSVDDARDELLKKSDQVRVELAGNLKHFELINFQGQPVKGEEVDYNGQPAGYVDEPFEILSYVSKHDNQTLWDINTYKLPTHSTLDLRLKSQILALSFPLLGQGIPFIHSGSEWLRSKSFERDSFDSGDWFNHLDFYKTTNNYNVGLPRDDKDAVNYELIENLLLDSSVIANVMTIDASEQLVRKFLEIRQQSSLLPLPNADEILKRVKFRNTGKNQIPGLIVMSIDNGIHNALDLDADFDAMVIVFNVTAEAQELSLSEWGHWELHPILASSSSYQAYYDINVRNQDMVVSPFSTAVFVDIRQGDRGRGWPVD